MPDTQCKGQMHGHNFPYAGADCTQCSVNQYQLSKPTTKPTENYNPVRPTNKNIHSELHAFVDQIRKEFGETAKHGKGSFGFYLGMLKRIGLTRAHQLYSESKEAAEPKRAFWKMYGEELKKAKRIDTS